MVEMGELRADLADKALCYFATELLGTYCELETVRDDPDELRESLLGLLTDLHFLADKAEINWSGMLAMAQREYEEIGRDEIPPL